MSYDVKYGWFSAKSVLHVREMNDIDGRHRPLAFWYRKDDGGMVLATEVTRAEKYTSNFDDHELVGNVSTFIRQATDAEALAEAEKRKKCPTP